MKLNNFNYFEIPTTYNSVNEVLLPKKLENLDAKKELLLSNLQKSLTIIKARFSEFEPSLQSNYTKDYPNLDQLFLKFKRLLELGYYDVQPDSKVSINANLYDKTTLLEYSNIALHVLENIQSPYCYQQSFGDIFSILESECLLSIDWVNSEEYLMYTK